MLGVLVNLLAVVVCLMNGKPCALFLAGTNAVCLVWCLWDVIEMNPLGLTWEREACLPVSGDSPYLDAKNFSFSVPEASAINGIEIKLRDGGFDTMDGEV